MQCSRLNSQPLPFLFIIFIWALLLSSFPLISSFHIESSYLRFQDDHVLPFLEDVNGGSLNHTGRHLLEVRNEADSSMILAAERTQRKDPLDEYNIYTGGWNISNKHYWASVAFTAAPFFAIAAVWFVLFGATLGLICLFSCCCRKEPYGYSRFAYSLSLILLTLFTIAAVVGCIFLYTGQVKFHGSTTSTLRYVVKQADTTAKNLRKVSNYLDSAKGMVVDSFSLPTSAQRDIDEAKTKINSSASALSSKTNDNLTKIQNGLNSMSLSLIILSAIMLVLAVLGFLFSVLGLQCLVYTLVIVGWFMVAATFILCGVFLLLHNVVADACFSMDEWVKNPTAHTALDSLIPCVDNATAHETLLRTKDTTYQLISVVNGVISNISNHNFRPKAHHLYYNQSGPLVPNLCNPFNADLTDRTCASGEVNFSNASQVWQSYICDVSDGICKTPGRLTPKLYNQSNAVVDVTFRLYHYGPYLVSLQDCSFVRVTFTNISKKHCPSLGKYTKWIYIGLVVVSVALMLSLILWVIYARERRHRVYTKLFNSRSPTPPPYHVLYNAS